MHEKLKVAAQVDMHSLLSTGLEIQIKILLVGGLIIKLRSHFLRFQAFIDLLTF